MLGPESDGEHARSMRAGIRCNSGTAFSSSNRNQLAALQGDDLAKANLGDPLFTPEVRAAGLLNLADIQHRLLAVPADPRAILRDPWY